MTGTGSGMRIWIVLRLVGVIAFAAVLAGGGVGCAASGDTRATSKSQKSPAPSKVSSESVRAQMEAMFAQHKELVAMLNALDTSIRAENQHLDSLRSAKRPTDESQARLKVIQAQRDTVNAKLAVLDAELEVQEQRLAALQATRTAAPTQ